ncbi:MAG: hypothetical protein KDA25_00870, partial [Phycisphaerales bacterium]|nr:hypothetical protein [Phycisphaerales bacterium]
MNHRLRIIHAALVVDGAGRRWAPGAIAIDDHARLLEAGPPDTIVPLPDRRTPKSHPQATLLPGLVNVHAHLDLTHLGTRPAGPDFRAWVDMVRAGRCTDEAG